MDRVILGDNQFFGVSHLSEEKGMERARRFQNIDEIIKVIDYAYSAGIRGFSFSTHAQVEIICDYFRDNQHKYPGIRFYPCVPYAHKYANMVNEQGILGAVSEVVLSDNSASNAFGMMAKAGNFVFTQHPRRIMELLLDAEMKMFRDLNVEVVFLQNIITDLLLGLGWADVFCDFIDYIENNYNARAGFMTLNMPRLLHLLKSNGVESPVICSAINKKGFQMNPGLEAYETALTHESFEPVAMSVLAAGALRPTEAIDYISGFKSIKSVIFGASTPAHITATKELIESAFSQEQRTQPVVAYQKQA
ncbi:hypothetical protein STSP2_02648 [Anaerohalosphaera lusitana]|uniref:Methylcobalamin:coenzyme M methyltransferase n=1 Tax=Anaerohalosphaera lusitana TaxID=1936003 RepID=A0A1U9NP10_9BACT|nr:hypothetical protein [Anaerohalosphaera lusitana]AQT69458.1 hypothetical protein STSP2_02648 [Anaerohalosphaera lusitana]